MAILEVTDFNRIPEVKVAIANELSYIDDDLVQVYWNDLAKWVGAPVVNLPTEPNRKVKEYLIYKVAINVAELNIGSDLKQLTEDIAVDQWETRHTTWKNIANDKKSQIEYSDVVDSGNLPDVEEPINSMLSSKIRG